ncbi:hypothetical protein [Paenibacillus sp. YN15]|uniref:hypothetical protein n=1 Tax=Paenibacillus sp. YN15 TaxID=1742774 RepID=UPI000DCE2E26|nr:hypothetical protein [Paenibacillus sp. YN15]RAV02689.1 hypothetical protein DQG13_09305 [Paenibacillus sp. YN15]
MLIPQFSTHVVQNAGYFIQCENPLFVERIIITDVYHDFPNDNTFKVYLFLCKHCRTDEKQKKGIAKEKDILSLGDISWSIKGIQAF